MKQLFEIVLDHAIGWPGKMAENLWISSLKGREVRRVG